MKVTKKQINRILGQKPETFVGSQYDWRTLIKSILVSPHPHFDWVKDKDTGKWERIKIK
jgi:hypothetical protein